MVQTTAETMLMRPTARVSTDTNAHKDAHFAYALRDRLRKLTSIRKDLRQILFFRDDYDIGIRDSERA